MTSREYTPDTYKNQSTFIQFPLFCYTDRMSTKSPSTPGFDEAYANLNPAQKEAVDVIDGPVMVIAGPGTGKTQILALRIANILKRTDTKPGNILALTFTDAGAHAMRERCRRYIGEEAYKIAIHTFHSLAGELIRHYPDCYPNIIGGRPASDIERFSIIEDIIESGGFRALRPTGDPLYYVRKLPGAIADMKKEYVTPDILSERIAILENNLSAIPQFHEKGAHKGKVRSEYSKEEKRIEKLKELLLLYRTYQQTLREKRLFDFEDMIVESVAALESNEDMLRDLQETYQYILADEHQDVNEAQNKILELLAHFHDRPNIFAVGDEKQSIYRFQGASLDNFLYFEDRFPGTTIISLTENYRSTKEILDIAHEHIKSEDPDLAKLRLPLNAAKDDVMGRLEYRHFSHEAVEDDWLIGEVKTLLEGGVPPEEIAVIVRYNRDVEHFAALLRRNGVDVSASADSDILSHPITKATENLMIAALELNNEAALFDTLIGSWWGINSGDLALVLSRRSYGMPLRKLIGSEEALADIGVGDIKKIMHVTEVLDKAREMSASTTPHHVLQMLIQESGLLDQVMESDPLEGARVLRRVYDDIESMVVNDHASTLTDVVAQLRYRRTHNLALNAPFIDADQTAVKVMTAHKSKGLEFHTVFIPRATDNSFGKSDKKDFFKLPLSLRQTSDDQEEEDDRRLFYVAMTRAKENLLISNAENTTSGKTCDSSRFLESLPADLISLKDTNLIEEEFRPESALQSSSSGFSLTPKLIRELFLARGLSVTHLNNYLEDPLKYFFENLLRRPQPQSLSLMKGNVVHEVLDSAVERFIRTKSWPSMTDISAALHQNIAKLPIGVNDVAKMHESSLASLSAYMTRLMQEASENSRPESSFKAVFETGDADLPEIPLTGKIDRIDRDPEGKVLRVVDYKTGKPKSRNEIEGKTKNASGNYQRQLVFYAILLELSGNETDGVQFVLSFVEPKEKSGEIVEHSFHVSKEEVEDLKKEILRVSKEIISGERF